MAESGALSSPSSPQLQYNVASLASVGASSPSSPLKKNDLELESALPEAVDTDEKVAATDASPKDEALNEGPNEVFVVTSPREAANMGVVENHGSEDVRRSQSLAPTDPLVFRGLDESRTELVQRVQAFRKDLENWRGKLDTQVKSYREELGGLQSALNSEVEQLRLEFQELRNTLKQQRELTSTKLAKLAEPSETAKNPKVSLPTAH